MCPQHCRMSTVTSAFRGPYRCLQFPDCQRDVRHLKDRIVMRSTTGYMDTIHSVWVTPPYVVVEFLLDYLLSIDSQLGLFDYDIHVDPLSWSESLTYRSHVPSPTKASERSKRNYFFVAQESCWSNILTYHIFFRLGSSYVPLSLGLLPGHKLGLLCGSGNSYTTLRDSTLKTSWRPGSLLEVLQISLR